jgi:hypothetical protein
MNFNDLKEKDLREEILSLNEENIHDFFSEERELGTLYGNVAYNYIYNQGDYFLLGEDKSFSSLERMVKYINETYDDMVDLPICEGLTYAKFKYRSKKSHDKRPKVIVLDNDYIYDGKGNIKNGRHDVLAFNLNYSKDSKLDKKAVSEIVTFAQLLRKNKKDVYQRIKKFYPEIVKNNIRCYKPERMKKIKKKDGWFWKSAKIEDLAPENEW